MNSKQMGSISFKESYPPPLQIPGEQAQSGVTAAQQPQSHVLPAHSILLELLIGEKGKK